MENTLAKLSRRRSLLLLAAAVGMIQIAAYYLLGSLVRPDGGFAIPQTDTLLYCQAARRIVEGHPFSFSEGAAVSTGTTGVIYPFILAALYATGLTGDALIRAGFFLNAGFYLVFLGCWCVVVDIKIKNPFARIVAAALLATMGQSAYSAMAQSDIGLLLAFSGAFAAQLARGRRLWYGILLVVFPWVRPEGVVCVIAFAMVVLVRLVFLRVPWREVRADLTIAAVAAISAAGVSAMNWALTGMAGYSSLAHKGYFKTMDLSAAIYSTGADLVNLAKSLFLGLPDSPPRDFYFLPLFGAMVAWVAILLRDWRRDSDWREWVWIVAFGGGLLVVAQSGWQNTNIDRYLGWLLPTVSVAIAMGIEEISRRGRMEAPMRIFGAIVVAFGAGMAIVHMVLFNMITRNSDYLREFSVACEEKLPARASVGAWADCGFAYEMSPRKVCHLSGIYSMEYIVKTLPFGVLEKLKYEPEKRFDYWFVNQSADDIGFPIAGNIAEQVLVGPIGYELLAAKWESFDNAAAVPEISIPGKTLKSRVDVGYDPDEAAAGYAIDMRYNLDPFAPFAVFGKNRDRPMVEVGRIVVGMDSMRVKLEPGVDVRVVMRTWPKRSVPIRKGNKTGSMIYEFSNPLKLAVAIDGEVVDTVELQYAAEGLSDVEFSIPGCAIKNSEVTVSSLGDHIACGYWFFQ